MKNGISVCMDYFNCTLPKNEQDTKHMTTYHDPRPVEIANLLDGGRPITIHRDPRRKMFFPCAHPECDHSSILRSGPYQHQRHCKYIKRDIQRAGKSKSSRPSSSASSFASSSVATAAVSSQSVRTTRRIRNQTIVSRGRAGRPSRVDRSSSSSVRATTSARVTSSVRATSSVRSASTSSASSGSIFDHTPPPVSPPAPSPPPPPASNNTASSAALTQLLTGMQQLADTVTRFNKRLDVQTQTIGKMNEQMEWLADQVHEIRTQNAGLDAHTESLRNDMDMVQDHLGDMLQDNQDMKEHLREAREDVGQVSLAFRDRGRQRTYYY
ncbi:hypothetical protein F5H01DRAFT_342603 [Linnemannia elongata]|nr:hypothetical protein F5H01DRAFT_342603 [Linnemannia elongata]